ncbi:MAG: guanylate kinase [Hyphomicrobiaceae bacterium]|nr:guanylate kinase [Hyphomicrobiaceae bacterium]
MSEPIDIARRGLLFVLSSPSGAGKTTLSKALLAAEPDLSMSLSATTRAPRPGEVDGVDYDFLDMERFEAMRAAGKFLEWARVFNNCYGTPKAPVLAALQKGADILFDIDWQGAQQLRGQLAADTVTVFILPPSAATLRARLSQRAQDSAEVVAERMSAAAAEISHWAEYDYVIVNSDIQDSLMRLRAILAAERAKRNRLTGLSAFVRGLQSEL